MVMIQLRDAKQLERAIERARAARLVVRRTDVTRMYRVENLDNGQVYTCNFFVRKSDGARFAHCTCKAGNPPVNVGGAPMYEPRPCKHLAVAVCLNIYDATVRRAAAMVEQMPEAA
jgi:hypothetical protein